MRILIPGAGNKILHIKNFKEVRDVEKVIITDIYPWTYGGFIADSAYITPRFDDPKFFESLLKIYKKEEFDFVIPIHDFSLYLFSNKRDYISKMPYKVIMNEKNLVDLVSDKIKTYYFFIETNIMTPKTYIFDDFLRQKTDYIFPYYIKPRYINMRGTSDQFYLKINDEHDLDYVKKKISSNRNSYIIQEYIEGKEVNVDFFCDYEGKLKSIVTLFRQDMGKGRGISRGEIFYDENINDIIKNICAKLKFIGPNQVQLYITNNNDYIVMEINGRFSGSTVLVKEAGINFYRYYIKMLKGENIKIINEKAKFLKMSTWEAPFFYENSNYKNI